MPELSPRVDDFLAAMGHARADEIQALRALILSSGPALEETIKWNAPSYRHGGDDRVTMRLRPGERVELILHRGAKKRQDAVDFTDASGLVHWRAPDRGQVVLEPGALAAHAEALQALVAAWITATAD